MASWAMARNASSQSPMSSTPMSVPKTRQSLGRPARCGARANPEDITSNTQWSVVFDNTEPAAAITLRRHWGNVDAFAL